MPLPPPLVVTSTGFDAVSRLSSLTLNLNGTTSDLTLGFSYNPAGQIASTTRSNDLYAWTAHYNVDRAYTVNELNQTTLSGSVSLGYACPELVEGMRAAT